MELLRETVRGPAGSVELVAVVAGTGLNVSLAVVGGPPVGTFHAEGDADLAAILETVQAAVGIRARVEEMPAPWFHAEPEADLTIAHTAQEGTTIRGNTRPWAPAIKGLMGGWKWYGKGGFWYRQQSLGRAEPSVPLERWAERLRAAGATVRVEHVETVAEAEANEIRRQHLLRRAERYETLAERTAEKVAQASAPRLVPSSRVPEDVAAVLANSTIDGNLLRLPSTLDRTLYVKVNKVLEALGGKWDRRAKAHVFPGDPQDSIGQVVGSGRVTLPSDLGYFPTPAPLAAEIAETAGVEPGQRVLEPSAGDGAIVAALVALGAQVTAVEYDARRAAMLRARFPSLDVREGDFLLMRPADLGEPFDVVTMNPPFAVEGHPQADIEHVRHALSFVKAGGRLVSIMSAGVLFRENRQAQEFRALVEGMGGSINDLSEGSFHASGTDVRTAVVRIPVRREVPLTDEAAALQRKVEHFQHRARSREREARELTPERIEQREAANDWAEAVAGMISERLKHDVGAVRVVKHGKGSGRQGWHMFVVKFASATPSRSDLYSADVYSEGVRVGAYMHATLVAQAADSTPEEAYQAVVAALPHVSEEEKRATVTARDAGREFEPLLLDYAKKRIKRATGAKGEVVAHERIGNYTPRSIIHLHYGSLRNGESWYFDLTISDRRVSGEVRYYPAESVTRIQVYGEPWSFDATGMSVEQAYQTIIARVPKVADIPAMARAAREKAS